MSNAYFAVATDSQFNPVFKARDEAIVVYYSVLTGQHFELLPRHVLSVRNVNNAV